jgi:dolichol-phosphate mannosyltransferase
VTNITLSIIITVYSEERALAETVKRLLADENGYIYEILLVVSPLSSEACLELCRTLAENDSRVVFCLQKTNGGVGKAVREGFSRATGDYIAIMSADLETEPEAVGRMVQKIKVTGCDLVIADRWLPESRFEDYSRVKLVLNWLFQHLFRRIFVTDLTDLTYGFKILRREVVQEIAWESTKHEIFIETTIKPIQRGVVIERVPTVWKGRTEGKSSNNFLYNLRYVWLAIKVACRKFLSGK